MDLWEYYPNDKLLNLNDLEPAANIYWINASMVLFVFMLETIFYDFLKNYYF